MSTSLWFDDLPVIGKMPRLQAAQKLRDVGETEIALRLESGRELSSRVEVYGWPFSNEPKPWQHTAHSFGFLAPAPPGNAQLPILSAGNIPLDPTHSLKNQRIKLTLDRLRV